MRRRFLSVLLSLCLALGLLPTAAFAQGESYVALGDSITTGFGLSNDEQAFPKIIAEKYGYELKNLSKSGATSSDLLEVVQASENADALENADLITITIGGNDLMGALYQFLADAYNDANGTNISAADVQAALTGTNQNITQVGMLTFAAGVIGGFASSDAATTALMEFGTNLSAIIAALYQANPDVTIIVANQYNPYSYAAEEATGVATYLASIVSNAFEGGVQALNEVIASGTGYEIADVYTAFKDAADNPCNAYFASTSDMNLDFHPNAYGHELMAGVISELLSESEEPGTEEPGGEEQPEPQVEQLWVNGANVLEASNYTVACGSGTAKYDAATNTLTLNNAKIHTGYNYSNSSSTSGIYVDGDLTIVLKGNSTIASNVTSGILADDLGDGGLTITGDGSLQVHTGISAIYAKSGNFTIQGNVKIEASIDTNSSGRYCIESDGSITIKGAPTIYADAAPNNCAIRAANEITVNDKIYRRDCTLDEMSYVKIENGEVVSGLHTPTVYVNGVDMSVTPDLSLVGGGRASYDPDTSTLTLHDAVITEPYIYTTPGFYEDPDAVGLYADVDLTIVLEGENTIQISDLDYALYTQKSVAVLGEGSLLANSNSCGIYSKDRITIEDATVTLYGEGLGIYAYESDLNITNSNVTIDTDGIGLSAPTVYIMDSTVNVTTKERTVSYNGPSDGQLTIGGDTSRVTFASKEWTAVFVSNMTITGGTVEVDGAEAGIAVTWGPLTVTGGSLTAVGGTLCGVLSNFSDLVLEGGTVIAVGQGEGSYGIVAPGLTMKRGSTLTVSGNQAAIRLMSTAPALPEGYLPDGYSVRKVDYQVQWGNPLSLYTIARDGATVTYDPNTVTGALTGAATSVTLMEYAVDEGDDDDDKDDDRDTGSTTESERNPDGSLTTTVTKPDGTTVETTRNPDGSKETVETKKDGTVVTTATDKSGNETVTTESPDGTSVISVTRTDGSTSATTVDEDGLSVTVAALSDSAVAQTGTVSLPMPAVTAAADLSSAPAVTLDLPADTAVKVEIPVANVTAGTVAVLVKADGTSEIVKTSVATTDGVVLTLSGGETVKLVDNSKSFSDVTSDFWGADAVAFASSRELFNGTSATDFSPNAPMDRAMIVTVLARLDGADTTTGDTWYAAGAQWAVASGISDGSGLDQNLTREQLATMLYRYAQYKGCNVSGGGSILSYPDAGSVSGYALEAMQWACGAGIIGGKNGLLDPAGNATRAEVATMLMRFVAGL